MPRGTDGDTLLSPTAQEGDRLSALGSRKGTYTPATWLLSLFDFTGTALTGDAIPTTLDPAAFAGKFFELGFLQGPGEPQRVFATITNVTVREMAAVAVPEPGALTLLGTGLLALAVGSRRRQKRDGQ